jgi:hypothetical protein
MPSATYSGMAPVVTTRATYTITPTATASSVVETHHWAAIT